MGTELEPGEAWLRCTVTDGMFSTERAAKIGESWHFISAEYVSPCNRLIKVRVKRGRLAPDRVLVLVPSEYRAIEEVPLDDIIWP